MLKNILFIDTSLKSCHVAVKCADDSIKDLYIEMERGHAKCLVPLIKEAMEKSDLKFSDLDLVICVVGPGSFTGLRVGIATARGIALAANIPVIGISSFKAMALSCNKSCALEILIDTKRGDYYAQRFNEYMQEIDEPFITTQTGSESITDENQKIDSNKIFNFAKENISNSETLKKYPCKPFYMRQAQAKPMSC